MQATFLSFRQIRTHLFANMVLRLLLAVPSGAYADEDAAPEQTQEADVLALPPTLEVRIQEELAPLPLDLTKFFNNPSEFGQTLGAFSGRQMVNYVPFDVDGIVRHFGKSLQTTAPESSKGIPIGRKFDDLYLIHFAQWPDVEDEIVANIRLNYRGGTEHVFPIRYGQHLRDWYFLPSYAKGGVSDPDSGVCWRRDPQGHNAPIRVFQSRLANPSPELIVESMDVTSARNLSSYNLLAATVANHSSRIKRRPLPSDGDRHFDGNLQLHIEDSNTGGAIEGALVRPALAIAGEYLVGTPFRSSASGDGDIPYPVDSTTTLTASVEKEGYEPEYISFDKTAQIPAQHSIRLAPTVE